MKVLGDVDRHASTVSVVEFFEEQSRGKNCNQRMSCSCNDDTIHTLLSVHLLK